MKLGKCLIFDVLPLEPSEYCLNCVLMIVNTSIRASGENLVYKQLCSVITALQILEPQNIHSYTTALHNGFPERNHGRLFFA